MRMARLGDVADAVRGVTFSASQLFSDPAPGRIACLTTSAVHEPLRWSTARFIPTESLRSKSQILRRGDILVSTANSKPNVGTSARVDSVPFEATFGAFVTLVRPRPEIDAAYLGYWFATSTFLGAANALSSQTTNIANLRVSDLLAIPIPLPAVEDQRRIATSLMLQIASSEAARAAAQGRVVRAGSARLRLLRDYIPLPFDGLWPWVRLDVVAEFLDSERRPVSATERAVRIQGLGPAELVPYYGANGQAGWIDDYLFDEPVVLLAEDGGAFGSSNTPIAYRIDGKAWVNNHAHVLRPLPGVDVDFLGYALSIRPDIGAVISGSTRGKLNKSVAAAIQVPLPPIDEQRRISNQLRARLAVIDAMEASLQVEREAIEALPAALLRRAFDDLAA